MSEEYKLLNDSESCQ